MRPRSHTTLFPYTTLFRSARRAGGPQAPGARAEAAAPGGGAVLRPRRAGAFGTPHGPGRRDDVAPGPGPLPRPRHLARGARDRARSGPVRAAEDRTAARRRGRVRPE